MDVRDLIALSLVPGVGPQRLRALVQRFSDPARVFCATPDELLTIPSLDKKTVTEILRSDRCRSDAEAMLRTLERIGGRVITMRDPDYPQQLLEIYDPPAFLYVLGDVSERDRDSIAVVGTRNPSEYGKTVAEKLCEELVQAGLTIVSGLARGIDTVAHRTAVQCGGRTIAVTGCGLDIVYPQENVRLSRDVRRKGAVFSEYPIGAKPEAGNFPRRNRIISGMTLGTIIVESSDTGGAMITATYALDQNREVFAVPGRITDKRSNGTNRLIQQGRAKLVRTSDDVLEEISTRLAFAQRTAITAAASPPTPELNLFEQRICDTLTDTPLHIDEISRQAGMSASDALVHLLSLEFKGIVRQLAGKMFSCK
jgi:DNA processing protein